MGFPDLDHEIRYIRAGDTETKRGQMVFLYSIPAGPRLVRQSGWTDNCPIESAFSKDIFHLRRITDDPREEQATDHVRRRDERVFEQEGG
jgi:hypothetical protein